MNFYTVAARMRRTVKKAVAKEMELITGLGLSIEEEASRIRECRIKAMEAERREFDDTCDLGLELMKAFKDKVAVITGTPGERAHLITIRPPYGSTFLKLKRETENFIEKWEKDWSWWEYAFEQKGETEENAGHGCHVHILMATTKANYYKSHIVRDAIRAFPGTGTNCIDVQVVQNLVRAKAYIRGDKNNDAKVASCAIDTYWRKTKGLKDIYMSAGSRIEMAMD